MPGGATRRFACWASASGPGCAEARSSPQLAPTSCSRLRRCRFASAEQRERLVAVNDHEAGLVSALATISGGGYLFHPEEADRSYKNFVNDFCRQLVCDPGAPRLSVSRCRSSYICDHLATGTRLSLLLEQAGIEDVESLVRYTGHVEGSPRSKAALRHLLAGEGP